MCVRGVQRQKDLPLHHVTKLQRDVIIACVAGGKASLGVTAHAPRRQQGLAALLRSTWSTILKHVG